MKIMQNFIKCLAVLILALPGLIYAATDCGGYAQCYQVEVIVFQDPSAKALLSEQWPSHPALPQTQSAIDLIGANQQSDIPSLDPDARTPKGYQLLPRSQFKMNEQEWALKTKAHYPVLLHIAWQQPLTSPRNAKPIHLYADPLSGSRQAITTNYSEPTYDANQQWRLNGTITLSKAGLISIASNLMLNIPTNELSSAVRNTPFANRSTASFRMLQRRRMRVNEVHYFDHPMFGLLVKVTPIKAKTTS